MKKIIICLAFIVQGLQAQEFVHPGVLHTSKSMELMREVVRNKVEPAYGAYLLLKKHKSSQADYRAAGPFRVISRDGEYRHTKSKMEADFSAAYQNALMWTLTGNEAHARKSLDILTAYADSLTLVPETNDAPLLVGLEGLKIIYALETLKYTYAGATDRQIAHVAAMFRRVFIPVMENFFARKPYTNGNWGPIVCKTYMAAGIFFDDRKMYNKAKNFYLHARDNGTIEHYIDDETGQIQESGRDQGHCMLGIGAMATLCEIAWQQGDDLYSALDNRLMKGFEYVSKYNTGNDVPFKTWTDVTGKYSAWNTISGKGRGRFMPVFEMPYNHYVRRKGLAMPYTLQVLEKIRPEGFDRDQPAFGGLLFGYEQDNNIYKNPVLHADYSDPDVIRVGDDYYMTASSFNCVPGLPILHSKDLASWRIVNYALPDLYLEGVEPHNFFDKPQHGKGVWAPCIRYHNGEYLIYWGDPDFGIYVVKTKDILGRWDKPVLVIKGKGRIDPSPLFDDDGRVYLVHAWAGSRAGLNSVLTVCELNETGTKVIGQEALVFDGNDGINHTVEGGKFYKKDGYYYILSPAGGVAMGWQIALRSKNVYGPYEAKKVLAQGSTSVNGPHQGGLLDTQTGEWWFMHFQDKGAYGRIVHLQPVTWKDGWPVMGINDADYCGEPVLTYKKPVVDKTLSTETLQESDEFDSSRLGFQWQWHANPQQTWGFPSVNGFLRMYGQYYPDNFTNFWDIPNLLLQKLTAPALTATVKASVVLHNEGDKAGLMVMGWDYSYMAIVKKGAGYVLEQMTCRDAEQKNPERKAAEIPLQNLQIDRRLNYQTPIDEALFYFRLEVKEGALCTFSYSTDGEKFYPVGESFKARQGKWIGAKTGLFIMNKEINSNRSWMDADWYRVEK